MRQRIQWPWMPSFPHLGVFVDEHELKRLREAAHGAGCAIVVDRERALVIDDLFGVRWS